jgi:dTDP-4-dehydrorhamnose 3,5-epimerase
MNKEIDNRNIIQFILWILIGLLVGFSLGNLMGLAGRELLFPSVVGMIVVAIFSYNRFFNSTEEEVIQEKAVSEKINKEVAPLKVDTTEKTVPQKKMGQIDGVIVSPLKTFPDDRGYFREMFRLIDSPLQEAAQVSATMSYPQVIKAFHYHNNQDDLWYCAKGMIQAVMYDRRKNSRTYGTTQVVPLGDLAPQTLFIPRGVVHGYKVLGAESALVIYATNQVYDPNDELRIPHDDEEIGF